MLLTLAEPSLPLRRWEVYFLAGLILLHCALGWAWIHQNQRPPVSDAPGHILQLEGFLHHLENFGELHRQPFPPLTYAVSAVGWGLFGRSIEVARQGILVFLALYIGSCWWLGREMGGRGGGAVVALAAAGSPWVAEYSRAFLLDFPAAAMVAFALATLVASRGFRRPVPTLLFGLALALAMLAKWSVLFFLLVPTVLLGLPTLFQGRTSALLSLATLVVLGEVAALLGSLVASNWEPEGPTSFPVGLWVGIAMPWLALLVLAARNRHREDRPGEWRPGAGMALAVGIGTLGCLPWYLYTLPKVREKILYEASLPAPDFWSLSLPQNAWFVANSWWAGPVILAVGVTAGLLHPAMRRLTGILAAGAVASLLFVSYVSPPDPRYLLPLLPLLAPLGFAWCGRVRGLAPGMSILLLALSLVQTNAWFLERSGLPTPPVRRVRTVAPQEQHWREPSNPNFWSRVPKARRPDPHPYPFLATLREAGAEGASRITVLYTTSSAAFAESFHLLGHLAGLPLLLESHPWHVTPHAGDFVILLRRPLPGRPEPEDPEWVRSYSRVGTWDGGGEDVGLTWTLLKPGEAKGFSGSGQHPGGGMD